MGLHVSYLIHGLHLADPTFLQDDWLTAHTTDFHPVFSRLVAILGIAGILKPALILLAVALHVSAALLLYQVVATITAVHHRMTVFLAVPFTDDALAEIARQAIARKSGARGLRAIMEEVMLDIMYETPSKPDVRECIITAAVVRKEEEPKVLHVSRKRTA